MAFYYQHDAPTMALIPGTLAEKRAAAIRVVGQYLRRHHHVKVGITKNPDNRWSQHRRHGWEKMVVIYASPRRTDDGRLADVRELEDMIVQHFYYWSRAEFQCHNERAGGAGPMSDGDQYVYLLLSGKWRKRSA